jgi:hypothetical protein
VTLAEHIAEAVLELLKSIPSPDKADLEVCIHRAAREYEEQEPAKSVYNYPEVSFFVGDWVAVIRSEWDAPLPKGNLIGVRATATKNGLPQPAKTAWVQATPVVASREVIDAMCDEAKRKIEEEIARASPPNQEGQ